MQDGAADSRGEHDATSRRSYPIITLCGSTRFKREFEAVNAILTTGGAIVLSVGVYKDYFGRPLTQAEKFELDAMHFRKIALSDAIVVIDPGGYIGESTAREIKYARHAGLLITRLSDQPEWQEMIREEVLGWRNKLDSREGGKEALSDIVYRTVEIPTCEEHEGMARTTVTVHWVCPQCGGPRGEPYKKISYDGSRRLYNVDGWRNPCGHIDGYADVRKEALELAETCFPVRKSPDLAIHDV